MRVSTSTAGSRKLLLYVIGQYYLLPVCVCVCV